MLVGIVLCSLHFAYEYSLMQLVTFTVTPSRSNNMLPFRFQQVLSIFRGNMLAVSVSGVPGFVSAPLNRILGTSFTVSSALFLAPFFSTNLPECSTCSCSTQ
jgi:hypothetical protein